MKKIEIVMAVILALCIVFCAASVYEKDKIEKNRMIILPFEYDITLNERGEAEIVFQTILIDKKIDGEKVLSGNWTLKIYDESGNGKIYDDVEVKLYKEWKSGAAFEIKTSVSDELKGCSVELFRNNELCCQKHGKINVSKAQYEYTCELKLRDREADNPIRSYIGRFLDYQIDAKDDLIVNIKFKNDEDDTKITLWKIKEGPFLFTVQSGNEIPENGLEVKKDQILEIEIRTEYEKGTEDPFIFKEVLDINGSDPGYNSFIQSRAFPYNMQVISSMVE